MMFRVSQVFDIRWSNVFRQLSFNELKNDVLSFNASGSNLF